MIRNTDVESVDSIEIRGARTNNLKNIDVSIAHGKLIVVTGPSGSGKTSLALDTIFYESQRQFIESLSISARQNFPQFERPDVDDIRGLQPAICIDQRQGGNNPRSTIGTTTDIYDFLRLLFLKVGDVHCFQCDRPIQQRSSEQINSMIMNFPEGSRVMLLAPMVRGRKGEFRTVFADIRKHGFVRVRVNGEVFDIEQLPELDPKKAVTIEAIVDRLVVREGIEDRLAESVQTALKVGDGNVIACYQESREAPWIDQIYSTVYACRSCNLSYEELEMRSFSFNSSYGACPECNGIGQKTEFDPELILDFAKPISNGGLRILDCYSKSKSNELLEKLLPLINAIGASYEKSLKEFSSEQIDALLRGSDKHHGLVIELEKEFVTCTSAKQLGLMEKFRNQVTCHKCKGSRLRAEANSVFVGGHTMSDLTTATIDHLQSIFESIQFPGHPQEVADRILTEIKTRLAFLQKVGAGYLSLGRSVNTLSGGEFQRVRLATGMGSGLSGICYVLDEPSIGLHPRDNQKLIDAMIDLQNLGNTVIVVEHDDAIMRQADLLIDIGPGAGTEGGRIVAMGEPQEVSKNSDSATGSFLGSSTSQAEKRSPRKPQPGQSIRLNGAKTNNLKNVNLELPLGLFHCLTGVSGSGKSSLISGTLIPAIQRKLGGFSKKPGEFEELRGVENVDQIVEISQAPIGKSARSNAATYTGIFDEIRKIFAKTKLASQLGFGASRFSFNAAAGRCEACKGHGYRKIEMSFMPNVQVTCEECRGSRFNRQTLDVKFKNRSIAEVLSMSIEEAADFFENAGKIFPTLKCLNEIGLGYLTLGQPANTISGGEAQRIKIATHLAKRTFGHTIYFLDEPTTGLHFVDVRKLINVLQKLVDSDATVVVIEHNLDLITAADWVVDLGPGGGEAGGSIVAEGTPEEVAASTAGWTSQYLRERFEGVV